MEWVAIITMIIEAIQKCLENRQSRESIMTGLRNPGPREAWVLRRILRKEGNRGRRLRQLTKEGIAQLISMSTEEVEELVAEAAGGE